VSRAVTILGERGRTALTDMLGNVAPQFGPSQFFSSQTTIGAPTGRVLRIFAVTRDKNVG
jgi:hypothetical protein